jgi:hypothetical protein
MMRAPGSSAWLALLMLGALSTSVRAQGAYVSASLIGDVVRNTHSELSGTSDASRGGEAIGFALRVGTEVASIWGVEVEFARPSAIESEWSPDVIPLADPGLPIATPGGTLFPDPGLVFPIFRYQIRTTQRYTTLSTMVWARQDLSERVSLAYLGGVSFQRTTQEIEFEFQPFPTPLPGVPSPTIYPPPTTESVTYRAGPVAGVEARIGLTDQVQFVPGIRLHGLDGGWLVRSSVGLGWVF